MNIAGMILGILGGLAGIGGAAFVLFVGGVGAAFDPEGERMVMGLGLSAYLFAILGLIEGATAMWISGKSSGFFLQSINPGLSKSTTLPFDVPEDALNSALTLHVRAGRIWSQETVKIALTHN